MGFTAVGIPRSSFIGVITLPMKYMFLGAPEDLRPSMRGRRHRNSKRCGQYGDLDPSRFLRSETGRRQT